MIIYTYIHIHIYIYTYIHIYIVIAYTGSHSPQDLRIQMQIASQGSKQRFFQWHTDAIQRKKGSKVGATLSPHQALLSHRSTGIHS